MVPGTMRRPVATAARALGWTGRVVGSTVYGAFVVAGFAAAVVLLASTGPVLTLLDAAAEAAGGDDEITALLLIGGVQAVITATFSALVVSRTVRSSFRTARSAIRDLRPEPDDPPEDPAVEDPAVPEPPLVGDDPWADLPEWARPGHRGTSAA